MSEKNEIININKTINFEDLRSIFKLKNQKSFEYYLETIYKDFCTYKNDKNMGISKIRFIDWAKLPIFICEKIFYSFDKDKDGFLSLKELAEPLAKLYFGTFEETAEVIFNIYDFDQDGKISMFDIKSVLAFLPIKSDKTKIEYRYQLESLAELTEILNSTFEKRNTLNLEEFIVSIIKTSDIYLQLLCFLYQRCPFQEKSLSTSMNIKYFSNSNIHKNLKLNIIEDNNKVKPHQQKASNIILGSPSEKTHFSPVHEYFSSKDIKCNTQRNSSFSSFHAFTKAEEPEEPEQPEERKKNIKPSRKYDSFSDLNSAEVSGLKGMLRVDRVIDKVNKINIEEDKQKEFASKKDKSKSSFSNQNLIQVEKKNNNNDNIKPIPTANILIVEETRLNNSNNSCSDEYSICEDNEDDDEIIEFSSDVNQIIDFPEDEKKTEKKKKSLKTQKVEMNENIKQLMNNEKNEKLIKKEKNLLKKKSENIERTRKLKTTKKRETEKVDNEVIDENDEIEAKFGIKKSGSHKILSIEGPIVKYIPENNNIYTIWMVLIDQDIYYYRDETKKELQKYHHLSGCFIKENGEALLLGSKFYSFSIIFSNKTRTYYCRDRDNAKEWSKQLRSSIGYQNFFEFYEMIDDLGQGSFGLVKLGIVSKTKEKVAIKILKKSKMKEKELEQMRLEIDILKISKHPNIVSFLDHFENSEYIFIVMEYIKHGSLKDFLKNQKPLSKLNEIIICKIIYQVASGIRYLHDYCIIHRDIKPDNIMVASVEDEIIVKIADFGLSKILAPHEKTSEGYGTLTYIAPEILKNIPYNTSVDIWSLGVLTYVLISKSLPFYDEFQNAKRLVQKIINGKVEFSSIVWNTKSNQLKDFISLCLEKDEKKRLNIDQVLKHNWFKLHEVK